MDGLHPHSPPAPPRIRGGGRSRGAGHTRLCRPRPAGGAGPPAAEAFGEGRQAWGAQRGPRPTAHRPSPGEGRESSADRPQALQGGHSLPRGGLKRRKLQDAREREDLGPTHRKCKICSPSPKRATAAGKEIAPAPQETSAFRPGCESRPSELCDLGRAI